MAYIIYNNDGTTILTTIATGDVDSSTTSLDLIGKNVNDYGQYVSQNFVRLLTNFSYNEEPRSPQAGQLWYNSDTGQLKVYNGEYFSSPYGVEVSGTIPTVSAEGDLWYDTINSQLNVYYDNDYKLVGPAVSGLFGKFGVEPPSSTIREDDTNYPQTVGVLYSYGNAVGLITTSPFTMKSADSDTYFNVASTTPVVSGVTVINDFDVKGDLYINGVKQLPPVQTLTAFYDITSYGNPALPGNITTANVAIGSFLAKVFSTSTNALTNEVGYPIGSDAKVTCYHTGYAITVRRFHLIVDPIHPTMNAWKSYDLYYDSGIGEYTNVVKI